MPEPSLAVVIPTYHRNQRLREAIASAKRQTHAPEQIIVVDGSGQAHARPVAAEHPEIDYIAQPRDEGPHAARSLGARHADADLVQFLDDDDRLHPDKIARQIPRFEEDVGVVYTGLTDEAYGQILPDPEVTGDVLDRALAMNTYPCIPSTMLIDADLVDELVPFPNRHGADDTGMKIELAQRTCFAAVDEPLVTRGNPEDPLARSWAHIEGRKRLLDRYAHLYEQADPAIRAQAARQTHYREGAKRLEDQAYAPGAVLAFARALVTTPDDKPRLARHLVGSLLGRPGLQLAKRFD